MKKSFLFYSDAGHGWMKVPTQLLIDLQIDSRITLYSYMRSDSVYLEEDGDMSLFFEEFRRVVGASPSYSVRNSEYSSIRNYESYEPYEWVLNIGFEQIVGRTTEELLKMVRMLHPDIIGSNWEKLKSFVTLRSGKVQIGGYYGTPDFINDYSGYIVLAKRKLS